MSRHSDVLIFGMGAAGGRGRWRAAAHRAAMRTCFGDFILDDGEKQLLHDGRPVHLTPKAYALLCYLVQQGRRAVSKPEILEHLWPATFVTEAALTSVVKELRQALGDDARAPRFIRGVRGFGYAFCGNPDPAPCPEGDTAAAPAGVSAAAPEFRVVWQHHELVLSQGENLLGRTHEAAVWVEDASVSRRHAIIRVSGRQATIEDCGSKNGTFVRGERVEGRTPLEPGEEFWLGSACLAFVVYERNVSTATAVPSADR